MYEYFSKISHHLPKINSWSFITLLQRLRFVTHLSSTVLVFPVSHFATVRFAAPLSSTVSFYYVSYLIFSFYFLLIVQVTISILIDSLFRVWFIMGSKFQYFLLGFVSCVSFFFLFVYFLCLFMLLFFLSYIWFQVESWNLWTLFANQRKILRFFLIIIVCFFAPCNVFKWEHVNSITFFIF